MARHYFLPPAIATIMFAIILFLSPPTTTSSAVVDIDGNPLEVGSRYYVLTAGRGAAGRGGLTFRSKPSAWICPNYVGQHRFWMEKGNPISLFPANQTQKQVSEGDQVNIAFGINGLCRNFGVWRMTLDNETMIPYVATDGEMRSPGSETSASWFKIEKSFADSDYKIVYCSEVPKLSKTIVGGKLKEEICQQLDATQPGPADVSFLSLVPIDNPLPFFGFVFQKAVSRPTIITGTSY